MDTPIFFDSHAHYFDEKFQKYDGGAEAAIRDAYNVGVRYILNAGTSPETSRDAIALAEAHEHLYASAGLHPSDSHDVSDTDLQAVLDEIKMLCSHEKVVALGEIGLDYYWDDSQKERQKAILDTQLCRRMLSESKWKWQRGLPYPLSFTIARHTGTRWIFCAHIRTCAEFFTASAEVLRWRVSF